MYQDCLLKFIRRGGIFIGSKGNAVGVGSGFKVLSSVSSKGLNRPRFPRKLISFGSHTLRRETGFASPEESGPKVTGTDP